jgi:pSer/pThr/pTyr-binding forkhead associated (FHA) protein
VVFIHYQSQEAADNYLKSVLKNSRGLGVLYGVGSSGKTTIVNRFVKSLPAGVAVAVVDGTGIGASELLATMLAQFGFKGSIDLADGRLKLFKEISERVIREKRAPLLVLENINKMYPSGLRALRKLASLMVNEGFALRIILVNKRDYSRIIESPSMSPIGARLVGCFELGPLTARETVKYLQAKLRASGVAHPHRVLPIATCVELHKKSGGWPGILDSMTLRAIKWADRLPIRREQVYPLAAQTPPVSNADSSIAGQNVVSDRPVILVSKSGQLLQEYEVKQPKVVIGRARLNDIVINNAYVSKYHAMLIFHNNTLFLVDLKSSNGIYVNSRRVRSTVLRHDDIVDFGNHRIKIHHPTSRVGATTAELDPEDTSIMKTVADMRRAVAKRILRIAPAKRQKSK